MSKTKTLFLSTFAALLLNLSALGAAHWESVDFEHGGDKFHVETPCPISPVEVWGDLILVYGEDPSWDHDYLMATTNPSLPGMTLDEARVLVEEDMDPAESTLISSKVTKHQGHPAIDYVERITEDGSYEYTRLIVTKNNVIALSSWHVRANQSKHNDFVKRFRIS